ncbi:DUF805 domain-containing protein [Actibacterium sp. D379-3]
MRSHSYEVTGFPALVMMTIPALILIIPFFQLWKRTGHSGWISLLMVIPVVNLIMVYVLAFKDWPAESRKGPDL